MSQSIAILGRQPALGMAELESLYGADSLHPLPGGLALVKRDPSEINFNRLGGTIKLAKLLTDFPTTDWRRLIAQVAKLLPDHLQYLPADGKIRLGLNVYGLHVSVNDVNRGGLILKKAIKNAGRSVRVVPNTELELNSAQTQHNQLTGPTGWEFVFIKDGSRTLLAQVVNSQDIDAYAARDQARPKRDSRVGMLPPKLAQIIVNLAHPEAGQTVLDPFCGTGVVLQEALLMGYPAYGTDLEKRMIDYSQINLDWLSEQQGLSGSFRLAAGDATSFVWQPPFEVIAGETYLGRPFSAIPDPRVLEEVTRDVDTIHRKFLRNVAKQTKPGFRMCLAVPAWHTNNGVKHLKMLASLEELGYTRMSFVHAVNNDLVYHRENQIVGRELVVLTRK